MHLAAHKLIAAADELDEFTCVNIWVTAVLHVFEQLGRHRGELVGRRSGCVERLNGLGEGFAVVGGLAEVEDVSGRFWCVHAVGENVSAGAAHGVVCRDLDHDLVEVLDDVLELLCREC